MLKKKAPESGSQTGSDCCSLFAVTCSSYLCLHHTLMEPAISRTQRYLTPGIGPSRLTLTTSKTTMTNIKLPACS